MLCEAPGKYISQQKLVNINSYPHMLVNLRFINRPIRTESALFTTSRVTDNTSVSLTDTTTINTDYFTVE